MFIRLIYSLLVFLLFSSPIFARTTVQYIVTTQEERKSTRFTLTEWLRIKERMKMMDVYLAMFSSPEKEKFRPELSLFYGRKQSVSSLGDLNNFEPNSEIDLTALQKSGEFGRAQLWLSNIINQAFGVRTLNIDLGFETYLEKQSVSLYSLNLSNNNNTIALDPSSALEYNYHHRYNTANLRIFGKTIQDSSMIIKYGEYQNDSTIPAAYLEQESNKTYKGNVFGFDMNLYMLSWLGMEGSYLQWGQDQSSNLTAKGEHFDYGLYIEISLFRFIGGAFTDKWIYQDKNRGIKQEETSVGTFGGLKIHF
ncbi:MAG: hypothetical protein AB8G05_27660 [Oligoflexales bacterium]